MYPSSVVSNVNVKRKHPSWCLYTKHKNIFKKKTTHFSLPFHTPYLLSVRDAILSPTGLTATSIFAFSILLKWMQQPLNLTSERWWRLKYNVNFHVILDSGLSHLVSQCSSIWNKNYRQINKSKTIPNIIPATCQTNTRTGPHLLCDTCRCHTWWGSYSWVQLVSVWIKVRD